MLPPSIPIFPLPNAVLFPNVFMPLHIFEPRYRAMVEEATTGDRIIGMVLLRPGFEADYEGRPDIYPIGCAGVITHHERLDDGRYNIVLRGIEKFQVTREEQGRVYRVAAIDPIPEIPTPAQREALRAERQRLETILAAAIERGGVEPRFPPAVPDEDLVNALAQYLDIDPIERQALLERDGCLARCRALIELLEMKAHAPAGTWERRSIH